MIGQDGKVAFVRNGDQLVRVSRCRIVKFGSEFQAKDQNCMKKGFNCDHGKINDDKRYHSESDDEYDSTTQSNMTNDNGLPSTERVVRMLKEIITTLIKQDIKEIFMTITRP